MEFDTEMNNICDNFGKHKIKTVIKECIDISANAKEIIN